MLRGAVVLGTHGVDLSWLRESDHAENLRRQRPQIGSAVGLRANHDNEQRVFVTACCWVRLQSVVMSPANPVCCMRESRRPFLKPDQPRVTTCSTS